MTLTEGLIRKTRTPKNAESILKGALKLTLGEKVNLVRELREDIAKTVETAKQAAAAAMETANGAS